MRILLFLASFICAVGHAACGPDFFEELQDKTIFHFCQVSLSPGCAPSRVRWDADYHLSLKSEAVGATTALGRGAFTSLENFGKLQVARTEILAEAMRTGSFFSTHLYGEEVFARAATTDLGITGARTLLTQGIFAWTIGLTAFLYQDDSPTRCNDTLDGAMKTSKITHGRCVDDLEFSENVVRFLSRPPAAQADLAAKFPNVCAFYQALSQKVDQDAAPAAKLFNFECKDQKPAALTTDTQILRPTHNDAGQLTGFVAEPLDPKQDTVAVDFKNAREIDSFRVKKPGFAGQTKSLAALKAKPDANLATLTALMKTWWAAAPVVTACCRAPQDKRCSTAAATPGAPATAR